MKMAETGHVDAVAEQVRLQVEGKGVASFQEPHGSIHKAIDLAERHSSSSVSKKSNTNAASV